MIKKIIPLLLAFALVLSCSRDDNEFNNGTSDYNHSRSVGASANDLLSNNRYNSLSIEIQYMSGYAPDSQAIEHVKNFLATSLRKDNGIKISLRKFPALLLPLCLPKISERLKIPTVRCLPMVLQWQSISCIPTDNIRVAPIL